MAKTSDSTERNVPDYKVVQDSFVGGMNRSVDPTKLDNTQYTLLINARNRYSNITPVKLPLELAAGLPVGGNTQGCYAAGSIIINFIDGLAYIRDFNNDTGYFRLLGGFKMDATVPVLYAELVPASTLNFHRQPTDNTPSSIVNLTNTVSGTPQCLVVQDGKNQPQLVFPDGSSRAAHTFEEWDANGEREYVPVGKMMLYIDGILKVVSPDLKGMYSSVTGRPLDFVVAIDKDGNKIPDFDATKLRHNVEYYDITCIARIDTPVPGGFLVSTSRSSYLVAPNFNDTLYGEPKYTNTYLFSTGALNQFSVTDILGDTTLIDFEGIKSFNAVTQYRIEGKNSPFFKEIFTMFRGIVQNITAAWTFDNYGCYAVQTIYGPGIFFYDTLLQKWAALDIYPGVDQIKQFAEIKTGAIRELFFLTVTGKFYMAFGSSVTAMARLYTKEYSTGDPEVEMTPEIIRPVFVDNTESGTIKVTPFIDRKIYTPITRTVEQTFNQQDTPISIPFGNSTQSTTDNLTFNFQNLGRGWKAGFLIEWNFMADLSKLCVIGTTFKSQTSTKQQGKYY